MRRNLKGIFILLVFITGAIFRLSALPCIDFLNPVSGKIITEPVCSLLIVDKECRRSIKKIDFQARYFPAGSDSAVIIGIGSVSRRPFLLIWDISGIPNQLFAGASFFAEATFSNGETDALRREGVFFLHKKIERPVFEAPFGFSGTKKIVEEPIRLPAPRSDVTIEASVYWNNKELVIITEVGDPLFDLNLSNEKLASFGIEILIDPTLSRKPFPGKEVYIYSIPLAGKPYRIVYKPAYDDSGAFRFEAATLPCDFNVAIKKFNRKGFTIYSPVPAAIFGTRLPETIGLNLVAKTLSEEKEVRRTSWIKASLYETYSPVLWGEIRLKPRPFFMNRPLIAVLAFAVGFFLTILISSVIMLISKPSLKEGKGRSDADFKQFASIKESLDASVTEKKITLEGAAKALDIPPKKLSRLIKRSTGMNFHTYVMYARIEIAKERLRSSHCTLESIAQMCGFNSTAEMEKYFVKFNRITPLRFRSEQQVV